MVRVIHGNQIQPLGSRRRRRQVAIFQRQQLGHPVLILIAAADLHQAADDVANHVMHEGIRLDIYHNIFAVARNLNVFYAAPRGARLTLHRAERSEVVFAQQRLRRPMHTIGVQRVIKMRHPLLQHRRPGSDG